MSSIFKRFFWISKEKESNTKALHTVIVIEYSVRPKFLQKFLSNYDAIKSVYTEYSEHAVFNPKTGVSNIPYFFRKFWLFDYDTINFVFLENTD